MSWNAVLGQDLIKQVFRSHLASGRVPNAYLLTGPDGVGKRKLALEMAKALNCVSQKNKPCDSCRVCGQITRGIHPDVHLLIPSGASEQIKIDQIRHIIGQIGLRPFSASFQVVIVDGAERLTEEAANSLLKSLEEPTAHTRFLLTTGHLGDCLPTVVSRCQLLRCQPLRTEELARILMETQSADAPAAQRAASLAAGSASRAIKLLQSWQAHEQRLARFIEPSPAAWGGLSAPAESRQEIGELLDAMMLWLRDVAFSASSGARWVRHAEHQRVLEVQAGRADLDRCLDVAEELVALRASIDQYLSPRLIAAVAREKWLSLMNGEK